MTKLGQKREFDYAKSDRLLFFSVFKENNEFLYSDLHLFGLEPLDSEHLSRGHIFTFNGFLLGQN